MSLNLATIDLASTLRTVPKNGSPSSTDYNDTQREFLNDLASITTLLNDGILPVLNGLLSTASKGLTGDTMLASASTTSPLFFSAGEQRQMSVAEVLTALSAQLAAMQTTVNNINARVVQLSGQMATTNQTSVLSTITTLSNQYRQLQMTVDRLAANAGLPSA